VICAALILTGSVRVCLGARVSEEALNTVVAIGRTMEDGSKVWVGSGFMLAHACRPALTGEDRYCGFIVTSKHVLAGLDKILVRFSPGTISRGTRAAEILEIALTENGKRTWAAHPDEAVDLALIPFSPKSAAERVGHFDMVIDDPAPDPTMLGSHFVIAQRIAESGAAEGEDVQVLGFPIGVLSDQLFGAERSYPVARRGSMAWVRPALDKTNSEFLIDTFIFPGNSGSPVFKPCHISVPKGQVATDCLIGMVRAYLPYTDTAISRQTGKVRVSFEENSGLAVVIPVDSIQSAIAVVEDTMNKTHAH
jgi:S1-C subfamily serine protease